MGKLLWSTAFGLGLFAWVHCTPVEIVYTDEGCDCPRNLGYQINLPKVYKPPKYTPGEYGYKVEVPAVPAKTHVSYSFDFTVEEPRPPRPPMQPKLELYAKVDRITAKKEDCVHSYAPKPYGRKPPSYEPPPPPSYDPAPPSYDPAPPCKCDLCGVPKPLYRYVYKRVRPCKCQRPQCKCNLPRKTTSNSPESVKLNTSKDGGAINNIRHKRDLRRAFYRKRKSENERTGRFLKRYHKSLPGKQQAYNKFEVPLDEAHKKTKRKTKKAPLFQRLHSRLVKRDIKGEFDLLEKEREQIDLTLPEIIQYMPETLHSNFRRDQCHFGCAAACGQQQQYYPQEPKEQTTEVSSTNESETTTTITTTQTTENVVQGSDQLPPQQQEKDIEENTIASAYKKRNAANYYHSGPCASSAFLSLQPSFQEPLTPMRYSPRPTNPFYNPQAPPQSIAYAGYKPPLQQPPQYVYDRLGQRYFENDGSLKFMLSTSRVPDPTGADHTPLQFDGDLETPPSLYRSLPLTSAANPDSPLVGGARQYPVQHVSNARLDRIISDIVYAHPDFIDASAHYGGALVDPEPLQKQQTKDFLKKLINGRLKMWFGDDEDHNPHYSSSSGGSDSIGGYGGYPFSAPPPIVGYFPGAY